MIGVTHLARSTINADILATLSQYSTYKARWSLVALYGNTLFHPLTATCVLVTNYNNLPIYDIDDIDDITYDSIYTGSDIYIKSYDEYLTYCKMDIYIRHFREIEIYDYKNSCGYIKYYSKKIFAGLKLSTNYTMYIMIEFVKGDIADEWQTARNRDKILRYNHILYHTYASHNIPISERVYSSMEPNYINIRNKRYPLADAKDFLELIAILDKKLI
jgi:hypothetical protein